MFQCKECGKEFGDWHALGGHMRTHWSRRKESVPVTKGVETDRAILGHAMGKLSEISPQEAWQVVVNWIMDVYSQERRREEMIQSYRLKAQQNEARIDAIQSELKRLQQMIIGGKNKPGMERLL